MAAKFRNHPGNFCRDPGHFVSNLDTTKIMEKLISYCNHLGHATSSQTARIASFPGHLPYPSGP
jgi:hypothetical protein